jgi:hypothetical protein
VHRFLRAAASKPALPRTSFSISQNWNDRSRPRCAIVFKLLRGHDAHEIDAQENDAHENDAHENATQEINA